MSQIITKFPIDILYDIIEQVDDGASLFSCLLVNRSWCKITVRLWWKTIQNFNTLVACLPSESIATLRSNLVLVSTPTPKPLLFNYATFVKFLSFTDIKDKVRGLLLNQNVTASCARKLLTLEVLVMLLGQSTLKKLNANTKCIPSIEYTTYPRDCFRDLTEISCRSDICSDFLDQVSQLCQTIRSMDVKLELKVSDGIKKLISVQKNLKFFRIVFLHRESLEELIPSLTKHSSTLIKLEIDTFQITKSLLFLADFLNLQELVLQYYCDYLEDFKTLQHVTFPKLKSLKFKRGVPKYEYLINFLELNGKRLETLDIDCYGHNSLNLAIANFCQNLRSLSTIFMKEEGITLKSILVNCQNLQSVHLRSNDRYLDVSEIFEIVVKHSSKTFTELKLDFGIVSELSPKELDIFFSNWMNRVPRNPISFIIVIRYFGDITKENMKNVADGSGDDSEDEHLYVTFYRRTTRL
ncbi:9167_t:CDS:2 [Funneliformis mosseae]|uniref:9167_t:CDS:1 n=1 Tax=Funneliformis mosseae TaxID=27381 RepID=A0A9N8WBR0_FUNMO|nr:9167_t:CDS:2 [Funneliformis mosseae]